MGTLILMRHAKSDWSTGVDDLRRPLADRGIGDAAAVGVALAGIGVPDLVLCSPARRTQQTWQLAAQQLTGQPLVRIVPAIYGADQDELLDVVRSIGADVRSALVIGHNPTLQDTASALAGPGSDPDALARMEAKYPTAGLAVLAVPSAWSQITPGDARLEQFLVPRA
jgi:phosphohistidine phosphatase